MPLDLTPPAAAPVHVFDVTTTTFEASVLQASLQTPILVEFWADGMPSTSALSPTLAAVAADYHGAFRVARVDAKAEPQMVTAFQVRTVPTLFVVKDGQIVDASEGALSDAELRELLARHQIQPAPAPADAAAADDAPLDPHAEVERLRAAVIAQPDKDTLKLDLALALLRTGTTQEAETLLDALPANLSTDDRALSARARLGFAALLTDAPAPKALQATIDADPADLRARHLLAAHHLVAGEPEAGLEQLLEMLKRDRDFDDKLPRRALIDAFRVVEDDDLVGRYRRKMSSLLLV